MLIFLSLERESSVGVNLALIQFDYIQMAPRQRQKFWLSRFYLQAKTHDFLLLTFKELLYLSSIF